MDFRIRQLQSFLTLAETLHYGRTARLLYMSQPTMTSQIKSLEESFGAQLFERDRRQVRLTDAGDALRRYARTIVETVDAAHAHLDEVNGRQRLRVSCGPWGQTVLLPEILRQMPLSYPGFELELRELTTEQKMAQLREGSIDALLMVQRFPVEGMRFEEVCRKPLVAMVSRRSPLARRRNISIHELKGVPIIAPVEKDCSLRQPFLRALFKSYSIHPKIVAVAQSCSIQLAYVAAGEGVVVAGRCGALDQHPQVVAVPFKEALPEIVLGIASASCPPSASMASFLKLVRSCKEPQKKRPAEKLVEAS
jgi:DNA-binding transcriptional LysR family regulator